MYKMNQKVVAGEKKFCCGMHFLNSTKVVFVIVDALIADDAVVALHMSFFHNFCLQLLMQK